MHSGYRSARQPSKSLLLIIFITSVSIDRIFAINVDKGRESIKSHGVHYSRVISIICKVTGPDP